MTILKIFLLSGFMLACSSYDRADEKPDEVAVELANPTWDNGVGQVIEQKCASCHANIGAHLVPGNTTTNLTMIGNKGFFRAKGNLDLIKKIKFRTFDSDQPMPPKFATQLSAREKAAVYSFLSNSIVTLGNGLEELCPTEKVKISFAEVAPIVKTSCASCHHADRKDIPPLTAEADFLVAATADETVRDQAIYQVATGKMPRGQTGFIYTPEGKKLLHWLCSEK